MKKSQILLITVLISLSMGAFESINLVDAALPATVLAPVLSPANSIVLGNSVTATVTVSGIFFTPTGTISFEYSANGGLGWVQFGVAKELTGGSATSDPYIPLAAGSNYLLRGVYSGDIEYDNATGATTALTVSKAAATVPVPTLNPMSPISLGQSVSASVTVSGVPGVIPSSTIRFEYSTDGGLGWAPIGVDKVLVGGSATSDSYTPLVVGSSYRIRAVYGGDANYNTATGSSTTLTVNKAAAIISAPSLNPSSPINLGQVVSASVTVSGIQGGAVPSGTVTFEYSTDSGSTWSILGTGKVLVGGSATSDSYTPLVVGSSYRIRAVYGGDANYNTATGGTTSLTVSKSTPTVSTPIVSPNPVIVFNQVSIAVTITGVQGSPTVPTGLATFQVKIGSGAWTTIGSTNLNTNGEASMIYLPLLVGTYQFQVIYAGDSNYNSVTSSSVTLTVNTDSATHLVVTADSDQQTAGESFIITVTVKDKRDNTVKNYDGTIQLTSSDNNAVLPPNSGLINGVGSFPVTLKTAGSQSVIATDTSHSSIIGSTGIQVSAAALHILGISTPAAVTAGSTFGSVTVTAYDAYNNVKTDYTGKIYFTSSDSTATLPYTTSSKYSFVSADKGVHTFSGFTLKIVPSQTITVSDGSLSKATTITVNSAGLHHFIVDAVGSQRVNSAFSITATAKDAYNNTITSYVGTPSIAYSAGSVTPASMTAFANGVGSTSVTVLNSGSDATLTISDSTHTGTSNAFDVAAAPTITSTPSPISTPRPTSSQSTPSPTSSTPTVGPSSSSSPSVVPSPTTSASPSESSSEEMPQVIVYYEIAVVLVAAVLIGAFAVSVVMKSPYNLFKTRYSS